MSERLWITWEHQRRNRSLSARLNAELVELNYDLPRWIKHPWMAIRTVALLMVRRPQVLFAQNPSIVLSSLAVIYGKLSRCTVVIDSHNAGLFPLEGRNTALNRVARWILRWADLTLVTNDNLRRYVEQQGGRSVVVPDPLPDFSVTATARPGDGFRVVFICTWAEDEPWQQVLDAALQVQDLGVVIVITGRFAKRIAADSAPANVVLTGFISDSEFQQTVADADAVMVLTTRADCLNCGAYEAVALEKPLLLSDSRALREYFDEGVLYTDNSAADIARQLRLLQAGAVAQQQAIGQLKARLSSDWDRYRIALEQFLESKKKP